MIAAIATQIGTAIQNNRLVRASVEQQRLAHEMQLAHDLQMKLLPGDAIVAPEETRDVLAMALTASLQNAGPHLGAFVLPTHLGDA